VTAACAHSQNPADSHTLLLLPLLLLLLFFLLLLLLILLQLLVPLPLTSTSVTHPATLKTSSFPGLSYAKGIAAVMVETLNYHQAIGSTVPGYRAQNT
jgi:hypothetical protein